jgi:glycosyltransferase involved in cell wall biosynthesis
VKLLAITHMYPPNHLAGAEMMLHTILRSAAKLGHTSTVAVRDHDNHPHDLDGVRITGLGEGIGMLVSNSDVVFTHLDETRTAMIACATHHKPLVHLVHNHVQLSHNGVSPRTAQLVVFNSNSLADVVPWPGPKVVLHPPVIAADYRTARQPGEPGAISLVNMSYEKGADRFYDLARGMPDRAFFGVQGAYGSQIVHKLDNVLHLKQFPAIRELYRQTRILLMPSTYESYGRVGVEAAASGIPTIASPTPGLLESLGDAGIFVDRDRPVDWIKAVEGLDDPETYREASDRARARSAELDRERVTSVRLFLQRLEELP